MSVTQEIKDKLDIVQYIGQFAQLKKAGRYYKANCPFHNERTPSFVVNPDTQTWRCFGACAEGGDVFSFAQKHHGWSFREALDELGRLVGVEVRTETPEQKARYEYQDRLRGMLQTAADYYHSYLFHEDGISILQYAMDQRGFTDETIKQFSIGYAADGWQNMLNALLEIGYTEEEIIEVGLAIRNENGRVYDRFRNRLMIPIRDDRGRVIGFGARALNPDDNPKYLNSPQTPIFDKSRTLFGLDMAKRRIRESETAVIVEGYMDVIQAHQAGYTNVVAQMGTAMTEAQLRLLAPRYAKKIVLALDADDAGQNATHRGLEVARQTLRSDYTGKLAVDIRILQMPGAKDPDDLLRETPQLWQNLVDEAIDVADFVIDTETAALMPDSSLPARQEIAQKLLPILRASENNLYNKDNIQKLALRLRIAERDLLSWAQEQQPVEPTATSSAEPPPFDYDDTLEPPPWDADDLLSSSDTLPTHSGGRDRMAIEAYCLRLLLLHPDLLYQVNRKLRELASVNTELLNGPLCDLSIDDFSQSQYRELLHRFLDAMQQDEQDPLDCLQTNIVPELKSDLAQVLVSEPEGLHQRVQNRIAGDFLATMKQLTQTGRLSTDPLTEFIGVVLQLRNQRLRLEREDMRFLQLDVAQHKENTDDYSHRIMLSMTAKFRIERALQGPMISQ